MSNIVAPRLDDFSHTGGFTAVVERAAVEQGAAFTSDVVAKSLEEPRRIGAFSVLPEKIHH